MDSMTVTDVAGSTESVLIAMAAHELGQTLQTLELACASIQRRAAMDAELAELAQLATSSLQRVRELLKKLLDISRAECGCLRVDEQVIAVSDMCEDLARRFASSASQKGLALHCNADRQFIKTDPVLLCGVLSNLVSNAIRYTNEGEVRIESALKTDGGIEIAVHDTGIGIARQQLSEIFRDFYRSEDAQAIMPDGLGLGLGVVHRWSKALGFPVTVRSEPGAGSIFLVHVPPHCVVSPCRCAVRSDARAEPDVRT
jgi:signal transduction histidine kinase